MAEPTLEQIPWLTEADRVPFKLWLQLRRELGIVEARLRFDLNRPLVRPLHVPTPESHIG